MKKPYFLPLLQGACFVLVSIFLQNCGGSSNLPIQEEREPTEVQLAIIGGEAEQAATSLPMLMPELWQYIFSHLDFEGILTARAVSSTWNELITGFRQVCVVGIENKPGHIIDTGGWTRNKIINFISNKLNNLTPTTIPSFAFYHLMGEVRALRQEFWPHLQGAQVHTVNLWWNKIGDEGAIEFAKHLQ